MVSVQHKNFYKVLIGSLPESSSLYRYAMLRTYLNLTRTAIVKHAFPDAGLCAGIEKEMNNLRRIQAPKKSLKKMLL